MPFICINAIQVVDPQFVEYSDKERTKPARTEEGRLKYTDKDRAIRLFKKGQVIGDNEIPRKDLERFLEIGAIEQDFDIRHQPQEVREVRQAKNALINEKPPGYDAPR
jgi:hypothetical protein